MPTSGGAALVSDDVVSAGLGVCCRANSVPSFGAGGGIGRVGDELVAGGSEILLVQWNDAVLVRKIEPWFVVRRLAHSQQHQQQSRRC